MDHVVKSPFQEASLLNQDCYEYMTSRWSQYLDRIALVDSESGDKYTFAELEDVVHNIAGRLQSLGFSKGMNLALCATNCVEIPILVLASWKLGGMVTVINALLKPGEISGQMANTKPNFIFLDKEQYQKLNEVIPEQTVLLFKESVEGFPSFASLKEPIKHKLQSFTRDVDARGAIFFSSGTTGPPKAVVLSHKNIVTELQGFVTLLDADMLMMSKWRSAVMYLPLSHVYGILITNMSLCIGASTIIMPRFEPKKYLQLNTDYKCELLLLVPPLAVLFTKNQDLVAKYDLSSIQSILCAAAVLLPEVATELLKVIPTRSKYVAQAYGMTEVSGASHLMPSDSFMEKHGAPDSASSVGVVMPNFKTAIRDLKTNEFLPAYESGEICSSGPCIMTGYLNNDEVTNAMIGADGWLKTGDIGYYDSNGYFYIVDRLKELIKYKGYQVSPSEMEDLLLTHPKIADAGVVGFPDEDCGELPSAFIVPKPGVDLPVDEIRDFVADKAAPFKKLRGPVRLVPQIPKSASGKILRRFILSDLQGKTGNQE